jgi:dihydrodipicolinate synthase/N-acetylneuraminate lyase
VTPLRDGGTTLDDAAFEPLVDFFVGGGLDGVFALGTTGEGILLSPKERRRAAILFVEAAADRLAVVVHCGAQTTADTVALSAHAAEIGAEGVAVIGPPYYGFNADELTEHFVAAASACAPTPFYVYELAARSGYAIPVEVVLRVRDAVPNLVGLKVSDTPFDQVEPYLLQGLDVFVGAEPLLPQALERGAVGTVSGLASAFPEVIADLRDDPTAEAAERVAALRDALQRFSFISALKGALGVRSVPVGPDVRGPLRALTESERAELERTLEPIFA